MEVILASASPARKKILFSLGLSFKVIPSGLDESKIKNQSHDPKELVVNLALAKAQKTAQRLLKQKKDFLIIAADSIAALRAKDDSWVFLDKPKNKQQARKTLLLLKGKAHQFYTGLVIMNSQGKKKTAVVVSKVFFKNFSPPTLDKILAKGAWKIKAGGYDIEENKKDLIAKYQGSFTNILGLPKKKTASFLNKFGVKIKTNEFNRQAKKIPEKIS